MKPLSLFLLLSIAIAAASGADETKPRPILKPVVDALPIVGGAWSAQGPAPLLDAQGVEGITDKPAVGALNAVVAHPSNANIVWVSSVNGGIWKTTNATSSNPTWTPQTDTFTSLSISALVRDPTDTTGNTLVGGSGGSSSFGQSGPVGSILHTTDGGTTWAPRNPANLAGKTITGLVARGSTIVASIMVNSLAACQTVPVFRSTNTGVTFSGASGLPSKGVAWALVGDPHPTRNHVLYTTVRDCQNSFNNGVWKSTDTGATWTKVSNSTMNDEFWGAGNAKIAVGSSGEVYVGVISDDLHLFRSGNQGATWTELDQPGQSSGYLSMAADPSNTNLVYIGRVVQRFPNFIGANDIGGLLFRVDASAAPGSQVTPLTHCQTALSGCNGSQSTISNSAPHCDSRAMAVDFNGNLLETDDGGIYRRTNPSGTGDWFSVNGTLNVAEMHNVVYDHVSKMILGGDQDTGTPEQTSIGGSVWRKVADTGGDGGDVAADDMSSITSSTRYSSSQYLISFFRRIMNSSGVATSWLHPSLTVLGGDAFGGQFVTPVELNRIDPRRIVFAGWNDLYESLDRGDTITGLGLNLEVKAMAYGGTSGGVGNLDVLWAIANPGDLPRVYVRTTGGGAPVQTAGAPGSVPLTDIAVDTSDWHKAYVVNKSGEVYSTADTGSTWTNVTGNLAGNTSDLRTIVFIPGNPGRIVVGGLYGPFVMNTNAPGTWNQLGSGLPNALLYDLDYDGVDDVLVAGTLGRGAWKLSPVVVSGTLPSLSINDITVTEGNSGTTNATFNVSLSSSAGHTVGVNYGTANGSAVGQSTTHSSTGEIFFNSSFLTSPYPSTIAVSGLADPIRKVVVSFSDLDSGNSGSFDALLVGPGGQTVMLMSDAGGTSFLPGLDVTFDDEAAAQLPQNTAFGAGTYRPTDYEPGDTLVSPAPAGPYGSAFSAFNGTSANGTWSLYILRDTVESHWGHLGGWSITFTTGDYTPTSGPLIFEPGTTSKTVTVKVFGDTIAEANEAFFVNLSSPSNATIADSQGQATITNDDAIAAPTNVVATATSSTNVNITWTAVAGASTYRVYKSSGGAYSLVSELSGTILSDPNVTANTAYLYKVRSFAGIESADSNIDLATTVIFTDATVTAGVTPIKLVHFDELRTAVNAVRALTGGTLPPFSFTSPTPATNVTVRAAHMNDLRNALTPARTALNLPPQNFTDPTLTVGTTPVRAVHINEVRNGVK